MSKRFVYYSKITPPTGIFSFIASVGAGSGSNGSTTSSMNTTGAKLIVMSVIGYAPSAVCTVSDSKSNTWTPLTLAYDSYPQTYQQFYYCVNPTVGSGHTFTTSGTASYSGCNVIAFDCTMTPYYDQFAANDGIINTMNPGSITAVQDNTLFITGVSVLNTGLSYTIDSGYTITNQQAYSAGNNLSDAMAYKITTGLPTLNPLWTWPNGTYNVAAHATFKAY